MFLGKGVLKICSKFTGARPCWSVISVNLQRNFIEITLRHGYSPVNLLHIFRTPFTKNTSGWLLLDFDIQIEYLIIQYFDFRASLKFQKQPLKISCKKRLCLKISHNLQENTNSFLIKLQASAGKCDFATFKRTPPDYCFWNFLSVSSYNLPVKYSFLNKLEIEYQ